MYTLATDRGDEEVANIYDPTHPSVLKLIKLTVNSAKDNNIPVSICGEMAGDTLFTMLLVGLNINSLSMGISSILKIKQFLNYLSFREARKISGEILNDDDNISIKNKLKKYRNYVINNFS
jgi:phosphotransferase system enzyme I (PtsI)